MVANAVLAMAVSEAYSSTHVGNNWYLKFILWAVAAVALFRALGSSAFGIINIVQSVAEGKMKIKWGGDGSKKTGLGGGRGSRWSSGWSAPSWMSGSGSWVSSKLSSVAPSSLGSTFGKG